jgi:hypothetical protein
VTALRNCDYGNAARSQHARDLCQRFVGRSQVFDDGHCQYLIARSIGQVDLLDVALFEIYVRQMSEVLNRFSNHLGR